ncbi:glycosyltransferase family 4 protein [Synechococcus sp. AH-736-G20]|nr:glycosyltransferase family 4 protein [Synechococcus sp. AH-736-G20]
MSLIIVSEGLSGNGAVANVAWQQALSLSQNEPVLLISDGLSLDRRNYLRNNPSFLVFYYVKVPRFGFLRRFSHVSYHLSWIFLVLNVIRRKLYSSRSTVICHSHPLAAAVALRFGERVRLIMVSHGDIFFRPKGSYDPLVTMLYKISTPVAHRRASVSVALSPEMAARIESHGVSSRRIVLIPNGLKSSEIGLTEHFVTPSDHWFTLPLRLLFVGRLDPIKGLESLLEALSVLQSLGLNVILDIVGTSTHPRLEYLFNLAHDLDVDSRINWLGSVPRGNLSTLYLNSHVVVVPSIDDPLPTVVLESMACGRPVIGSSVGGIKYMVLNNKTGLLVPPNNSQLLASAIEQVYFDRSWLLSAGHASRERASDFSWTKTSEKLTHVLNSSIYDDKQF